MTNDLEKVIFEDEQGFKHVEMRQKGSPYGIPCDDPPVMNLDWNDIARKIHNRLVELGILSWTDVQRMQNSVMSILNSEIRKPLLEAYKLKEREVN